MKIPNEKNNMSKKRHGMPQISDFDLFVKDLEENDISLTTIDIDPNELTPTQSNFSEEKVDRMIENGSWNAKPIITSDDDFVVDGHHRWLAAANLGKKIECRVVGLYADDLLEFLKGKPYVEKKKINEDMSDTLNRVQSYYTRVAKGEGGERFASLLTRVSDLRQVMQDNKDSALKNRAMILQYLGKIEKLFT